MKLNNLPSESREALPILKKIREAGYEAYFVGDSVRDVLLNCPIHGVDITTSSYPEETKSIFHHMVDIRIEHGTVLILEKGGEYEITTLRTEDAYVGYRRPSSMSFVCSLEEDLKRHDFTANAFALDETGLIIDKSNGLADLEVKLLRAVESPAERFNEDALHIMRGFRSAASLDSNIEPDTFATMAAHAPLFEKISVERPFIEFDKLLTAPFWRKGIKTMITSQAQRYLPYLGNAHDNLQQLLGDLACDYHFRTSEQAWSALLLALDVRDVRVFSKAQKASSQFQKDVEKIVAIYRSRLENELGKMEMYRYDSCLTEQAETLRAGFGLPVDSERIEHLDKELTIHDKHEIVVNDGVLTKELQYRPDPELGRVLRGIGGKIVLGKLANNKEAIFDFIRKENK